MDPLKTQDLLVVRRLGQWDNNPHRHPSTAPISSVVTDGHKETRDGILAHHGVALKAQRDGQAFYPGQKRKMRCTNPRIHE